MGVLFNYTLVPSAHIIGREFGQLARGFRTFRVPLEKAVESVGIQHIIHQFEVGGDPAWEPHAESTVERRSRQGTLGGYPQDILVESGALFAAATAKARWTITGDEAWYSGNFPERVRYAPFHMTGANLARGGFMPARPFIQMTDQDVDEIQGIFGKWVDGIILTRWLRRVQRLM
jgi:phage gpG-like protein